MENTIDKEINVILETLWKIRKHEKFYFKSYGEQMIKESFKSRKKELICDFFKFFRDNGEANIGMTIEQFVDDYLKLK